MAVRIPRGFDADTKPAYNEVSEGIRPVVSNVAIEPYFQHPIFDMDQYHNDPIVLPAGTLVGTKWDAANNGEGQLVPAVSDISTTGGGSNTYVAVASTHTSDETDFGVTISGWYTPVYPLGMVYKPIYMFPANSNVTNDNRTSYENYRREHKVPVVTDYVVQVPARTPFEHQIRAGDTVMVSNYADWNGDQTQTLYAAGNYSVGTFMAVDEITEANLSGTFTSGVADTNSIIRAVRVANYIVGKCLAVTVIGSDSNAQAGDFLQAALANSRFTKATSSTTYVPAADATQLQATSEFKNLELVQTVPGHRVTGSGTLGVPGFLAGTFGARSDSGGLYRMLTILLRVV